MQRGPYTSTDGLAHYTPLRHTRQFSAHQTRQLANLTEINIDDLLRAFELDRPRHVQPLLRWLCRRPARQLAQQVLFFDAVVAREGLHAGGTWAMRQFVRRSAQHGQERLPANGPLLIVANHPGLYDTIALFAAITRPDLRILAAERPFLQALLATSRHLIDIGDAPAARMHAVRAATRHLRAGGALLTFPAGRIEPDPAVLPGAVAALDAWSESLALFIRMVPGLTVLPAVVSGVLSPAALRHPLAAAHHDPDKRHLVAATLQVVFPSLQCGTVQVSFGQPLVCNPNTSINPTERAATVIAEARRLMEPLCRAR